MLSEEVVLAPVSLVLSTLVGAGTVVSEEVVLDAVSLASSTTNVDEALESSELELKSEEEEGEGEGESTPIVVEVSAGAEVIVAGESNTVLVVVVFEL